MGNYSGLYHITPGARRGPLASSYDRAAQLNGEDSTTIERYSISSSRWSVAADWAAYASAWRTSSGSR